MNREIKFRAWDKKGKEMFSVARIDIADGSCYRHLFAGECYDYWNNVELMQYTGIKDYEGKEIYEGDILKCKLHNGEYENYLIAWSKEYAEFEALNRDKSNFICASIWNQFKIIGNIYENPELLEVK